MNSLKRLIATLNTVPRNNFTRAGPILQKYNGIDWKNYQKFNPERYERAKVYQNNEFEIYIITWGPEQESPIHDHPDYGCWLKMLQGNLHETIYNLQEKPIENKVLVPGDVGFMHNDYGYHKIANKSPHISTSLHVYSPSEMGIAEIMEDCGRYQESLTRLDK